MELRHLRYFVGVAEELHFGRAAARLGISQPPLSQQIIALEEELGVQLFIRTSRNVGLTEAGLLFLPEARATLLQADRAVAVAHRAARGELGELTVGFNPSAPFVPAVGRAIHDYRVTWPDVHLTLAELSGPELRQALEEHSVEIGFLRSFHPPGLTPPLSASLVLREGMVVAMRPDHELAGRDKIKLNDLHRKSMILYQRGLTGGFTEQLQRLMRTAGVEPIVAQEVREVSTMFGLVAAGVGLTIVASSLRALQPSQLVYRDFDEPEANSAMWLVHRQPLSEAGRHFLSALEHAM